MIEGCIDSGLRERRGGVLFPLQAIGGDDPELNGTMGPRADRLIKGLSDAGLGWWHDLPFSTTDHGGCPYSSPKPSGGAIERISIQQAALDRLITGDQERSYFHDIGNVDNRNEGIDRKRTLLAVAFRQFDNDATPRARAEYETWCREQGSWLDSFAVFTALTAGHDGKNWQHWSPGARDRSDTEIRRARLTPEHDEAQFEQWLFNKQAARLKEEANRQNVRIIGDVPFYVGGSSVEVWKNPELYSVDEYGNPKRRAGVPPDYFSDKGQVWGNPIPRWDNPDVLPALYESYRRRFGRALEYADAVRVDHARALANYYAIAEGETDACNAQLEVGPGGAFLDYLESSFGRPLPFIAEDLGDTSDSVDGENIGDLIERYKLPGTIVPQFAPWGNNDFRSEHFPHNAKPLSVAYSGTHDNLPVNYWAGKLLPNATAELNRYCGIGPDTDPATGVIKTIWDSPAGIAIASIVDVLGKKEAKDGYNEPGTMRDGNWSNIYPIDEFLAKLPWLKAITLDSRRSSVS